jgi:hypothetical protein
MLWLVSFAILGATLVLLVSVMTARDRSVHVSVLQFEDAEQMDALRSRRPRGHGTRDRSAQGRGTRHDLTSTSTGWA